MSTKEKKVIVRDIEAALDDSIAEGDKVVFRWTGRASQDNKQMAVDRIYVYRIADGRIAKVWVSFNPALAA